MKPEVFVLNKENYNYPDDLEIVIDNTLIETNYSNNVSVNISFVNEKEITRLNRQYRNLNEATDVLSFEAGTVDPETGKLLLGDIVICVPFVENQSEKLGNIFFNELKLMVIHGMLHLIGFDHDTIEKKSIMWNYQSKILESLQINLKNLPE